MPFLAVVRAGADGGVSSLAEPLWVGGGAVVVLRGFEELELAFAGGLAGAIEDVGELSFGERLEGAGGFEGLVEDGHGVDASDEHGDWLGEDVVEGLDGFHGIALEDIRIAEGLHGEDADALFDCDGHDVLAEGTEVGVHDVDGHLDGVEVEAVLLGYFEHAEMDDGVFVAGEADVADLARFFGGDSCFDGATRGEDAVGVFHADDLVELDEVDHVGLEAAEGLFELLVEGFGGAAVHLGHEEDFSAVAVAESLPHADFADAVVVVPAVVHEAHAVVDGFVHDGDAFGGVALFADVEAAEADGRDSLAGGAEFAIDHIGGLGTIAAAGFCRRGGLSFSPWEGGCSSYGGGGG